MQKVSEKTLQEMAKEDPWLGSLDARILFDVLEGDQGPETIKALIDTAEPMTEEPQYQHSATLPYFLGMLHSKPQDSLSDDEICEIIRKKVGENKGSLLLRILDLSDADLLEFMRTTVVKDFAAMFADRTTYVPLSSLKGMSQKDQKRFYQNRYGGAPERGAEVAVNVPAALAYIEFHSIRGELAMTEKVKNMFGGRHILTGIENKALEYFAQALMLSGEQNPTVFREVIQPGIAPVINRAQTNFAAGDELLRSRLVTLVNEYNSAKERVGMA